MAAKPRLVATCGPLQGQTLELAESEVSLGRAGMVTFAIDHMSVSRKHCVFLREGDSFKIRDTDSLNGTLVNGIHVEEQRLKHGDSVTVGNSTFLFLIHDDDLASNDVRLTDLPIDSTVTVELRKEDAAYLDPARALAGADTRAIEAFDVLLKLGTAVQATHSLSALQEEVLQVLMEAISAETGAVVLTGGSADQILSMFGRRADGGRSVPVSNTVLSKVLRTRTALLNNNASESLSDARSLVDAQTRSLLCVPLVSGDRVYGALYLTSTGHFRASFDEFHLQLLTAATALLAMPLEKARQVEWLTQENQRLQADIDEDRRLIGNSEAMKRLYGFIARVASTDSTVLVRGESGTGKELVAHAIHRAGPRAKAPFVVVNCAALKGELLESDLFGHEKGAFTSAIAQKKGKFEIADGGTVFLDELAELALDLQVKLLRVLQEREFERIGGTRPIKVNVRVIAATDRDLEGAIRQGRFRHELYYRLNVVAIECPPLRGHPEDIVPLANHFASLYASRYNSAIRGISPEAQTCLKQYDWPGNVRELQNAIERAVVLGDSEIILPEDLPESILDSHRPASPTSPPRFHDSVREAKRERIQNAIHEAGGNVAEAARLLGVNRTYLHRLIRNLGIEA
jgi:Nif-specific regulatory protein